MSVSDKIDDAGENVGYVPGAHVGRTYCRAPGCWKVVRHSGRTGATWRTLYEGDDEASAWEVFYPAASTLRQGTVRIVTPEGKIVAGESAPRLRTRW